MIKELDQGGIDLFLSHAAFQLIKPGDRARLITHIMTKELAEGDLLFDESSAPDEIYLIKSGSFWLERNNGTFCKEIGFIGEELVLGGRHYKSRVVATVDSVVYIIPTKYVNDIISSYQNVKSIFFNSYINFHETPRQDNSTPEVVYNEDVSEVAAQDNSHWLTKFAGGGIREVVGWLSTIFVPLLVWQLGNDHGMSKDAVYFLSIIACTVIMWIFNLVPAFVPPLFSILTVILFDVAPSQVAAAGFSSNGFFMLLSIFSIGALMIMSGLTYRISLLILQIVPASPFWYNISLFMYGLILTPVMPSQIGRTVIVSPFISTLIEAAGGKKKDLAVTHFIVSGIAGVSLMASIFLTGKPANLIIFGLFDGQTQFSFEWAQWLYAASFTGVALLVIHFIVSIFIFRGKEQFSIPRHVITSQLHTLGAMSRAEWGAVAAIGLIFIGILTSPYHRVEIPWLSLTILVTLLLFGALRRDDMSKQIDWSILIFIGSIITWVPIMKLTGIDAQISQSFGWVGVYMKTQLPLFIFLLCMLIVVIRLALPELVTEILLVTLLLPIASTTGISLWLIGFVVLTMAESYIFPYQAPYHLQIQNQLAILKQDDLYDEKKIVKYNVWMIFARICAIYASFPFWKLLDII